MHTRLFHWFGWAPMTLMFHPPRQWTNHVFFIMSTWQRSKTVVIFAPSCNLDVYINYFYNQLAHTLLEVCVCVRAYVFYFYTSSFSCAVACTFSLWLSLSFSASFLCKVGAIHHRLDMCVCVHASPCACMQTCIYVCVHTWNQYWGQMIILLQQDLNTQRQPATRTHWHKNSLATPFWQHLCN